MNTTLTYKKTQKWLWVLGIISLLGAMSGIARAADKERRTITVSGQAKVQAAPDRAVVNVGAQSQENTAAEATAHVNSIINAAIANIKDLGIGDDAIQTTRINLYPVYENLKSDDPGPAKVVAYRATNSIQVTVDDLSLIGKVFDAANKAGGNLQNGVNFELKDDAAAKSNALKLAAQEARAKAQTIADALGVQLVGVQTVNETNTNIITPRPMYAMRATADTSTPVQTGQLDISAGITVTYIIK